jgi:hypothetical protein
VALEFDTEKGDELDTLRQRLGEAAAWFVTAAGLPDSGFPRSARCHPSHLNTDRKHVVWWVANDRKSAVKVKASASASQIEGRLLGYGPDETVNDGASEAVTSGFFNWEDEPPWDLWLGYIVEASGSSYLVSWIPPVLVQTAQDGIDVNPVACLFWLEDLEQALGLGATRSV